MAELQQFKRVSPVSFGQVWYVFDKSGKSGSLKYVKKSKNDVDHHYHHHIYFHAKYSGLSFKIDLVMSKCKKCDIFKLFYT